MKSRASTYKSSIHTGIISSNQGILGDHMSSWIQHQMSSPTSTLR